MLYDGQKLCVYSSLEHITFNHASYVLKMMDFQLNKTPYKYCSFDMYVHK